MFLIFADSYQGSSTATRFDNHPCLPLVCWISGPGCVSPSDQRIRVSVETSRSVLSLLSLCPRSYKPKQVITMRVQV